MERGNMGQINEYQEIITRFATKRTNVRIPNGLPQHASILVETMFLNATAEMRIFTKELTKDVFGGPAILAAIKQFLSKPYASLKILLQLPQDVEWTKEHPLFHVFNEFKDKNILHGAVLIKSASGSYSKDEANHFAIMDNDGFRYETDHYNCKAIANFNEPNIAKKLIGVFDSAFEMENSQPIFELKAS